MKDIGDKIQTEAYGPIEIVDIYVSKTNPERYCYLISSPNFEGDMTEYLVQACEVEQ